jgi:site-specific DNA recombinase
VAGRNVRGTRDGERGGRVPLGYRRIFRDGKAVGVEVDHDGAAVVRRILGMRDAGMTLRAIAATLNAEGVPGGRGGSWGPSAVKLVTDNRPIYAGGTRGASGAHWPAVLAA